jgi:meso-butanediol dehydrogenase / (S,S)-butanediol dehydrogenase / diacetyl reductase
MPGTLAGKVALVTGSTRGIGRSTAELFAAAGAKVAVTGRSAGRGERVAGRIRDAGGDAKYFGLDVTDESSIAGVISSVVEHFGSLTTVVNNAAPTDAVAATIKPMIEYSNDEWSRILSGTLTANVFWVSKHAWPHLVAAQGASITNISSTQSLAGLAGFAAYAAAKGGVNSLTRVMAVEGAEFDIRCNCIIVGRVITGNDDKLYVGKGARLTRIGRPMDIASLAGWLASDDAEFMTGELITADGGAHANGNVLV